jgi:hypothetical protein
MSISSYFKTLDQIEDRVTARMTKLRQAERDVALHCGGMAFDDGATAADVYRAGLDHIGVSRRETAGLSASELRVILKNLPISHRGGVVSGASAAMAYDSASHGPSVLDSILKGVPRPRDLSHRNDFRR